MYKMWLFLIKNKRLLKHVIKVYKYHILADYSVNNIKLKFHSDGIIGVNSRC